MKKGLLRQQKNGAAAPFPNDEEKSSKTKDKQSKKSSTKKGPRTPPTNCPLYVNKAYSVYETLSGIKQMKRNPTTVL